LEELLVIWYSEHEAMSTSEHQRPAMSNSSLFKWRHFEAKIILCAVRWHLRHALSYRDVEELMHERVVSVDHTTLNEEPQPSHRITFSAWTGRDGGIVRPRAFGI
jgi:hypothetical protein